MKISDRYILFTAVFREYFQCLYLLRNCLISRADCWQTLYEYSSGIARRTVDRHCTSIVVVLYVTTTRRWLWWWWWWYQH